MSNNICIKSIFLQYANIKKQKKSTDYQLFTKINEIYIILQNIINFRSTNNKIVNSGAIYYERDITKMATCPFANFESSPFFFRCEKEAV